MHGVVIFIWRNAQYGGKIWVIEVKEYGDREKGIGYTNDKLYGFNWKESKEPPADKAKAGRMSYAKESALYLASDEATACSEVRTELRQLISVATFFSEEEMEILDFSKLNFSRCLETNDEKYDISAKAFLERVRNLFTIPVYADENEGGKDYRVTQKIAKYFRDKGYQGFKYASFYTGGDNYTFFCDDIKKFRWQDSRIVINYATANLFLSMDRVEEHADVRNMNKVEEEVDAEIRGKLFKQTKNKFYEEAKNMNYVGSEM